MANIRFRITQNEHEWKLIEEAIKTTRRNNNVRTGKSGLSNFIAMEISTVFKSIEIDEKCEVVNHIKKDFEINISEENSRKIELLCKRLRVSPAALISKMILLPHLIPKNEKESPIVKK